MALCETVSSKKWTVSTILSPTYPPQTKKKKSYAVNKTSVQNFFKMRHKKVRD